MRDTNAQRQTFGGDDHIYRIVESGIRMHVYGLWVDVPEDKVQFRALPGDTGETAGGHWCGSGHHPGYGPEYYITHCAILPPNSVSTHGVFAD